MWEGYPGRDIPPWRDTGVAVRGPVVADVVQSFSRAWAEAGPEIPADELPDQKSIPIEGTVDMRVLGHVAATTGLYRLEQLIAVLAQKTLWLTDAYFVGTTSYVQALRGAAMDGVDVRLLVPGSSGDLKFLRPISRAGYRPLLEAGVRVFEWNGSMLHAKTAVADGRWARVGSSNLNLASWLGNWELDVAVEDLGFAYEIRQCSTVWTTPQKSYLVKRTVSILSRNPSLSISCNAWVRVAARAEVREDLPLARSGSVIPSGQPLPTALSSVRPRRKSCYPVAPRCWFWPCLRW